MQVVEHSGNVADFEKLLFPTGMLRNSQKKQKFLAKFEIGNTTVKQKIFFILLQDMSFDLKFTGLYANLQKL